MVEYRDLRPGYRVGNDGTVWTRMKQHGGSGRRRGGWRPDGEWRRLNPFLNEQGYLVVTVEPLRPQQVHLLVIAAFHGPRPRGLQCRHLDGNSTNNDASNLRWGTHKENMEDKVRHGRSKNVLRGSANRLAKLTEAVIPEIRRRLATGERQKSIALSCGVDRTAISAVAIGRTWTHVA